MAQDSGHPRPPAKSAGSEPPYGDTNEEPRLEYLRAFNYLFENANWLTILLLLALCTLIPVIGFLLVIGYQFVVLEALIRSDDRTFPEFDFSRFSTYLLRGLWPWLAAFIVELTAFATLVLLVLGGMMCFLGALSVVGDSSLAGIGLAIVLIFLFVVFLASMLVVLLVSTPMMLRAGLTQEFGEAFRFDWVKDFIGRTLKEMILFYLFLIAGQMLLMMVGSLLFCVGAWFAAAWGAMAQAHMFFQLYRLYLARGGEPLTLKDPDE